jgi:dTDP-4-amino-4,6-dideoxygalactose transaminase
MSSLRVPLNDLARHNASLAGEIDAALGRVRASGRYILGEEVAAFEKEFAEYCGVRHAVGVGNGLNALEIGLRALGVGPGHDVATVANAGGFATAAILNLGARPRYVEIDPATFTMDLAACEETLCSHPKVLIVTHLYGRLAEIERIAALARQAGVYVLEDCAQAHGASRNGRHAGTFGEIGCFSFYPTKNLGALGDGGAIITNDDELAERVRALRQYGWSKRFTTTLAGGTNSRLDEIQAAILRVKLKKLDSWNQRRREIADRYRRALAEFPIRFSRPTQAADDVVHLLVGCVVWRDELRNALSEAGVATAVHYPTPDYSQSGNAGLIGNVSPLVITEEVSGQVITLPSFPELVDGEVDYVVDKVKRALDGA